uniref:ATP_Ca_trans_C domain-containing protein n=1 Tax=Ascaris lumbricoides TaxID=6252 RepID=A0A0M3I3Y8_ASCLU
MFLQIRVVKAFQAGLDRREPSLSGPSAARLREISRQLKLQVEHEGKGGVVQLLTHVGAVRIQFCYELYSLLHAHFVLCSYRISPDDIPFLNKSALPIMALWLMRLQAYRAQFLVNRGKMKQCHRCETPNGSMQMCRRSGKRRLQLHCRAMQCARSDYSS